MSSTIVYLVDNNALTALTGKRIESDFFRTNCRVTPDVLWEAAGRLEQLTLASLSTQITIGTLEQIRTVMRLERVGDISLVNLYKNKGAADPGLLATILEAEIVENGMLLPTVWILVTDDKAVRERAAGMNIKTLSSKELSDLIDSHFVEGAFASGPG